MGLLKIRNADGTIQPITVMKGDKGEGVPDGGTTGQIVKKTEDGTEWAGLSLEDAVVMSNSDTSVSTASITKRGLYEVAFSGDYTDVFLLSISDLSRAIDKYIITNLFMDGDTLSYNRVTIRYQDGTISVFYRPGTPSSSGGVTYPSGNQVYITEVRLLVPYA